jgi:hypothetical protein
MAEARMVWLNEKCRHGKCGGDLYVDRDAFGRVKKKCLLCSRAFELTKRQLKEIKKDGLWP